MKGMIITAAAIAISVAGLMSESQNDPSKSTAIITIDHSWTCDYHFDKSTNLWM